MKTGEDLSSLNTAGTDDILTKYKMLETEERLFTIQYHTN